MTAPTPKDDIVPPPPPRSAYGKFATVFAVIDSTGKANPDSVSVCGVTNAAFARELAAAVAKVEFNPAMSEGRPTRSVFTAHLSFGRALPVPRD